MTEFVLPDLPITQLLVRTRDAIQVYDGPVKQNEVTGAAKLNTSPLFGDIKNLRNCPLYSPNGSVVCYVFENRQIGLYDTTTGEGPHLLMLCINSCSCMNLHGLYVQYIHLNTYV